MKRILQFLCLFFLCLSAYATGTNIVVLTVTITNVPSAGDTFVPNGATRTWRASPTVPSTEITIGADIGASATNLFRQLAGYQLAGPVSLGFSSSNVITIRGAIGEAMAATTSGTWATIASSTYNVYPMFAVRVPAANEPTQSTATNIFSQLALDIGKYSTNAFAAGTTLASTFVQSTGNQTVGGLTFTATSGLSNSAPIWTFDETDAGTDLKIFQFRSEAGHLILYMATDAGSVASNQKLFEVERPGLSALSSDSLFRFKGPVQFDSTAAFTGANINISGVVKAGQGFLSGSITDSLPGGQASGLYSMDGSAPFADPSTGFSIWSAGAGMKYRTSVANEGAGQENFVHNRTGSTLGAGTDYTLTTSTAFVDFGTTDPKITLPTDGTYLIWADVAITAGGTANDDYRFKLRNETTSTDLSGSDQEITYLGAAQLGSVKMQTTTTASASNVIAIWGFNNTAARGTVNSARTRISYVRLY